MNTPLIATNRVVTVDAPRAGMTALPVRKVRKGNVVYLGREYGMPPFVVLRTWTAGPYVILSDGTNYHQVPRTASVLWSR